MKDKKLTKLQSYLKNELEKWPTKKAFADHLGISDPYLSQLMSGVREGRSIIPELARRLGISPLELMEGVTFISQDEISREERIPVYTASEFMAKYVKDGMLVVIPPRGKGEENMGREDEERRVGILIENKSYQPAFMQGDIVIVDPDTEPKVGDLCLVIVGDELLIRRLSHLDPDETHFTLPGDEFRKEVIKSSSPALMEIWGKAVNFRRKL